MTAKDCGPLLRTRGNWSSEDDLVCYAYCTSIYIYIFTCYRGFGSGAVTTCSNNLGLSWPVFKHPTFRIPNALTNCSTAAAHCISTSRSTLLTLLITKSAKNTTKISSTNITCNWYFKRTKQPNKCKRNYMYIEQFNTIKIPAVTTCFNKSCFSRLGFDHPTFCLQDGHSNRLRHRRSGIFLYSVRIR